MPIFNSLCVYYTQQRADQEGAFSHGNCTYMYIHVICMYMYRNRLMLLSMECQDRSINTRPITPPPESLWPGQEHSCLA